MGERGEAAAAGPGVLGKTLRERRHGLGLTIQQVADAAGCQKSYLSALETGRRESAGEALLERLERALSLESGQLLELARWERTPEAVRAEMGRARREREAVARLRAVLGGLGGVPEDGRAAYLDEAWKRGDLSRAIEALGGDSAGAAGGAGGGEGGVMAGTGGAGGMRAVALPLEVPLINKVSAGYPAGFTDLGFPARVADEYVRCPDVEDPDAFAARVVGDSMSPAYAEGDVVVFSPARALADGCDCYARLEPDHESTFKRVYFEKGADGEELIRLQPVNSRYAPRVLPREMVSGLYRAVRVIREV